MAISSPIPADELALFNADRPILVGLNLASDQAPAGTKSGYLTVPQTPLWSGSGNLPTVTVDDSDPGKPAAYGIDDFSHKGTCCSLPDTIIFYHGLPTTTVDGIDCLIILQHNFGTIGADLRLFIDGLNVLDYAPPTDDRVIALALDHTGSGAQRYNNVSEWQLRVQWAGTGEEPCFGEIILGRRRQLKHWPLMPYDPLPLVSNVAEAESASGVRSRYAFTKGRKTMNAVLAAHEDSYVADIEAFFQNDTDYMSRPWVYIERPSSAPEAAYWFDFDSRELSGPIDGYIDRHFRLAGIEQGPHFLATE